MNECKEFPDKNNPEKNLTPRKSGKMKTCFLRKTLTSQKILDITLHNVL
jgi:hypothetical protein